MVVLANLCSGAHRSSMPPNIPNDLPGTSRNLEGPDRYGTSTLRQTAFWLGFETSSDLGRTPSATAVELFLNFSGLITIATSTIMQFGIWLRHCHRGLVEVETARPGTPAAGAWLRLAVAPARGTAPTLRGGQEGAKSAFAGRFVPACTWARCGGHSQNCKAKLGP